MTIIPSRARRLLPVLTMSVLLGMTTLSASIPTQRASLGQTTLVDRFLAPESQPLVSYRAYRRLTASTRGGRLQGTIEAWTTLDPVAGFNYQITVEEGSSLIRRKVLIAALDAERKAVRGADARAMTLTRDNYDFVDVSDDRDTLMKVDIKPRRKHAMLLEGSVFLVGATGDLVRVEGEPSQRPSFWTRRVHIVREYARLMGVRVPVAMQSTADVLIVGSSSFSMTYRYVQINGEDVSGSPGQS